GLALIFGLGILFFLNRFAFSPMEAEIRRRSQAEAELKDINDQLEQRVARRTQEISRLSSVVEQTDDIVVITDPQGNVEYVNPSFESISEYRADEVLGRPLAMIKSGIHDGNFYRDLWDTIIGGHS
ncbi:MAG: PAS domain S-box protein, partial [Gammaproteobacteria bacterium]|nr:PAS domain S-box protein [Gammaproteobacteria bacterium]NIT52017.1 PAS domain S-box protein [candidate division Zixibacteria bacterium]NIW39951.1 PAS domain S-box protein [candidate division Zixibacteria bacterium]